MFALTLCVVAGIGAPSQNVTLNGNLFDDRNADSIWNAGDQRCVNWRVYLDNNNNSVWDTDEPSRLTDQNGWFQFSQLDAGTYRVRQVVEPGWRRSSPINQDSFVFTLSAGQTGVTTFGNTQAVSSITGTLFNDANADSMRGENESGLPNWSIYIDANNNQKDDFGERWAQTNSQGQFEFTGLPAGSYTLRATPHHGWTTTLGSQSLVATVSGVNSVSGFEFGVHQEPEPYAYPADQLVSWYIIGGSSSNDAVRQVGWPVLLSAGWKGFVQQYIVPDIQWGVRRIMLHNPFGTLANEDMQLDQALSAHTAGLNWLLDDFVEAWRPITDQGIQVIAYVGSARNDSDFTGLNDSQWWNRYWASLDLIIQSGMDVAFDMIMATQTNERDWQGIVQLRQMGFEIFGEPRPPGDAPHWCASNVVVIDSWWPGGDPEVNPTLYPWAAKNAHITGEVVRLITQPPNGNSWQNLASWLPEHARNIMRQGNTVGIGANYLRDAGLTLPQILRAQSTPTPTATSTPTHLPTATPAQSSTAVPTVPASPTSVATSAPQAPALPPQRTPTPPSGCKLQSFAAEISRVRSAANAHRSMLGKLSRTPKQTNASKQKKVSLALFHHDKFAALLDRYPRSFFTCEKIQDRCLQRDFGFVIKPMWAEARAIQRLSRSVTNGKIPVSAQAQIAKLQTKSEILTRRLFGLLEQFPQKVTICEGPVLTSR